MATTRSLPPTAPLGLARSPGWPLARLPARGRLLLELAAILIVLGAALALRLPNLDDPTDNFDEGAYLESLLLMRHGYQPVRDINTGEGPLNLYLAYTSYALGGFTLTAARTGTAVLSLSGVLGVALAARALGGPLAGLAAGLFLALSPSYLRVSRWVGPEAIAVGLAALAVGAAAWAFRTDRDRWRIAGGILLALANLIQASVPMSALAVGLLALKRSSLRATLLAPLAALLTAALVLTSVGAGSVVGRVVSWRMGGQQLDPAPGVIAANAAMLVDKMLHQEQYAFYALAAAGLLALFQRHPRAALAVGGWLAAQLGLLLIYTELSAHLGTTLLPPLAILGGLGFAAGLGLATRRPSGSARSAVTAALCAGAALWYVSALPAIVDRDRRLIAYELSMDRVGSRDDAMAVRLIARYSAPDRFVLTDQPYLAFLADRKVPPELVDPSTSRINAGALTTADVEAALRTYDPAVVVLWTGKLPRLPGLLERIDRDYELVRSFGTVDDGLPRAVYRKR